MHNCIRKADSAMASNKVVKSYKRILEGETAQCVTTHPVCSKAEVGLAVAVGPYVSYKRNLTYSKLVCQVSYYK
jgi:hypothetical protein